MKKNKWLIYFIGKYSYHFRKYYKFNCPGKYTWGVIRFIEDTQKEVK